MTPLATYRVQLRRGFTFFDAAAIVPYLDALGITDFYASPVFTARAGSDHGYDVVDPTRLNPELGGEPGFTALSDALRARGMGLVMDIVPNHMAASPENLWWWSVLENGPSSEYANYFDIIWHGRANEPSLDDKVLLPILGGHYGTVLENQELQITLDEDGLSVSYWETKLPLDPKSYRVVLEQRYGHLKELLGAHHPQFREYEQLIEITEQLPDRLTTEPDAVAERRRETGRLKQELWRLYTESPEIHTFLNENIAMINGVKDNPDTFDILDRLLSEQAYRLAFWRVASQEINYRRFFDVADLVSMRIEDEAVFDARHAPLDDMVAAGQLTGLRIDHVDGLHDPEAYLRRLQRFLTPSRTSLAAVDESSFYVVVEKILAEGEDLRDGWPVAGTTGYDFLNLVNGVFVDASATDKLDALYRSVSGIDSDFADIAHEQKRRVMGDLFTGDVRALVARLDRLTAWDRHGRDLTQRELGQALFEIAARFPVYRTYVRDFSVADEDREWVEQAVAVALDRRPELRRAIRFIRRVLLLEFPHGLPEKEKDEWLGVVMRWQQFSGPIMAKGHEDTALYVYNCLVSVNDVGGDPGTTGVSVGVFHRENQRRLEHWPHSMLATSTHDTKRSEDVRARINVVSELPDVWAEKIARWQELNASKKRNWNGQTVPDGNVEWLIYQTLIGAWPLSDNEMPAFVERLKGYLRKAGREAKTHTSWINPVEEYEEAMAVFVDAILDARNDQFLSDVRAFERTTAWHGALNSLSQIVLKATSPGVPDFYQGTEIWDLSLVDPDNRRPVDFVLRRRLLDALQLDALDPADLLANWRDGRVKLHVTQRVLDLRRQRRALFLEGDYLPLDVAGQRANHVVAFGRRHDDEWAIVVAARLTARLAAAAALHEGQAPLGAAAWADTVVRLPAGAPARWRDALSTKARSAADATLRLADTLSDLPVAVLVSE